MVFALRILNCPVENISIEKFWLLGFILHFMLSRIWVGELHTHVHIVWSSHWKLLIRRILGCGPVLVWPLPELEFADAGAIHAQISSLLSAILYRGVRTWNSFSHKTMLSVEEFSISTYVSFWRWTLWKWIFIHGLSRRVPTKLELIFSTLFT